MSQFASARSKSELRQLPIRADSTLGTAERETTMSCPNDQHDCRICTEVPTHIKWVLSISESIVESYRLEDDAIVALKARVPKGIIKFQHQARKSDTHSQMVSYGPHDVTQDD